MVEFQREMEQWRPAPEFEDYYEVSSYGNVRRKGKNKNLKGAITKFGYIKHTFSINGFPFNVLTHSLVARAFNGPCPKGLIVRHKDGNCKNNIPSNLPYGTYQDNSNDAIEHGTMPKGSSHSQAKLDESKIKIIRASNTKVEDLATKYNVSKSLIYKIKQNKIWSHI